MFSSCQTQGSCPSEVLWRALFSIYPLPGRAWLVGRWQSPVVRASPRAELQIPGIWSRIASSPAAPGSESHLLAMGAWAAHPDKGSGYPWWERGSCRRSCWFARSLLLNMDMIIFNFLFACSGILCIFPLILEKNQRCPVCM